jgi:hypothetical protein
MLVGNFHFRQSLANAPYRSYKSDRSKSPRAAIFPAHTHDEGTENGMGCSCSWTGFDPNSDKDNPTDAK